MFHTVYHVDGPAAPPPGNRIALHSSPLVTEQWIADCLSPVSILTCVQSSAFICALRTCEDLLLCSPAGSGKSIVGLLAVLHQLRLCNGGEIFWVDAVMREQATTKLRKHLRVLDQGWQAHVHVVTPTELLSYSISFIRNPSHQLMPTLIVLDRLGTTLRNPTSGPALEAALAIFSLSQSKPRYVCLCDNVPRPQSLAKAIGVAKPNCFAFDARYRGDRITTLTGISLQSRVCDFFKDTLYGPEALASSSSNQLAVVFVPLWTDETALIISNLTCPTLVYHSNMSAAEKQIVQRAVSFTSEKHEPMVLFSTLDISWDMLGYFPRCPVLLLETSGTFSEFDLLQASAHATKLVFVSDVPQHSSRYFDALAILLGTATVRSMLTSESGSLIAAETFCQILCTRGKKTALIWLDHALRVTCES